MKSKTNHTETLKKHSDDNVALCAFYGSFITRTAFFVLYVSLNSFCRYGVMDIINY